MKYLGILIFIIIACGQQTSINQRSEKMYEKMRLSIWLNNCTQVTLFGFEVYGHIPWYRVA